MFLPSKHLLSAFYKKLPSKNPSKNLVFTPSKNPSKKHFLLENLLRTLLRSVQLHDPLVCTLKFKGVSLRDGFGSLMLLLRSRGPGKEPQTPSNTKIRKKKKRKKYKTPHRGWGPENTKKYRKNTKIVIFGPLLYFFSIFFVFLGPPPG